MFEMNAHDDGKKPLSIDVRLYPADLRALKRIAKSERQNLNSYVEDRLVEIVYFHRLRPLFTAPEHGEMDDDIPF